MTDIIVMEAEELKFVKDGGIVILILFQIWEESQKDILLNELMLMVTMNQTTVNGYQNQSKLKTKEDLKNQGQINDLDRFIFVVWNYCFGRLCGVIWRSLMELKLIRRTKTDKSTIGDLFINGEWYCYTLEDAERPNGEKVYGDTAIPLGTYIVTVDFSPHFNRLLPHVLNVPNFEGIRIHPGNTDKDTEGCILVGSTKEIDFIGNSRETFEPLFAKIQEAVNQKEQVLLTIQEMVG